MNAKRKLGEKHHMEEEIKPDMKCGAHRHTEMDPENGEKMNIKMKQ